MNINPDSNMKKLYRHPRIIIIDVTNACILAGSGNMGIDHSSRVVTNPDQIYAKPHTSIIGDDNVWDE